jgi:hypothetical protein
MVKRTGESLAADVAEIVNTCDGAFSRHDACDGAEKSVKA